ncbi:MAG: FtsX-like permease family protein [Clostridia bacterium]|nr:FtsX-like permease family protein [Clostridia bacterium]
MSIILKFVIKNIKEKKLRTFLIIFSITVSTMLFLAAMAASDNLGRLAKERAKAYVGMAEIIVYANDESPSDFFMSEGAYTFKDQMEFISEAFLTRGNFKFRNGKDIETIGFELAGLDGIDPDTLKRTGRIKIAEQNNLYPFEGNKLIMGKFLAEKYKVKVGQKIDLFIEGSKHSFSVAGIAQKEGIYLEDGISNRITVPIRTLQGIYGLRGKITHLLIKPKNLEKKQYWIEELSKVYSGYVVEEAISEQDIKDAVQGATVPLILALVLVLLISVFIIYVSFKVIMAERLPMIGTFRSIGAARWTTDFVMFAESLAYGFLGGITGCILGSAMVFLIVGMLTNDKSKGTGTEFAVAIHPGYIITAFLLAIVLSLISSAVPILRASKIPVKDIVLNKIEKVKKNRLWKPVIGIILLIFYFIAPQAVSNELALPVDLLCIVFVSVSMVTFIPWLTLGMVKVFENLYVFIFGNIGMLAAKNLRENKSILTNIVLLAMGIGALLMIFTVSFTAFEKISGTYKDMNFEIMITNIYKADRGDMGQIAAMEGIQEVYGLLSAEHVEIVGSKKQIAEIMGVDRNMFPRYFQMHCRGDEQELFEELENGRNIILPSTLEKILRVKKGDFIKLQTEQGKREYKIIGFLNSTWQDGRLALMAEKYVKMDFEQKYFNSILVKTSKKPEDILKVLKKRFQTRNFYGHTKQDFEDEDNKEFGPVLSLMKGFSLMAMLIGVFGVLNNFAISFIERKRSIAMMRSVGLGKNQTVCMIFIEALTIGMIGGIIGMMIGVLSARLIPYVLLAINLPDLEMSYSPLMFAEFILSGILVTVIASISPALKSSRLNLIDAIKYE